MFTPSGQTHGYSPFWLPWTSPRRFVALLVRYEGRFELECRRRYGTSWQVFYVFTQAGFLCHL